MKVSIIGGTGFVGSAICRQLLAAGHQPRLLVRPGREHRIQDPDRCEVVAGEVSDPAALERCLAGTEAVIYLIGILREFPQRGITFDGLQRVGVEDTIAAAKRQGVERFVLMSANGIRADGTPYQRSKFLAEEALKESGLRWTIFRPSVIFGDPEGRMEFCSQLKKDIIDSPVPAPLFYSGLIPRNAGGFELAPVFIDDVAAAFVLALSESRTESQTYSLCGPQRLSWKEILTTIAAAVGKTKLMLPAPAIAVKATASLFDRYAWFPISRDQIEMLMEGNVCTENDSFARLGLVPTPFGIDRLDYLNRPA
ncbi:epimerase [Thiocapsa imhoffii]|uniref:Epimerase n=1 Tax=Thiocapsa imhoffii TaxID=382777 RepID=A0A9X0WIY2_9GAMM|nr:NAD(P)H-binding protein [Thiocapsa imhoffii]MBK1645390.1 epimerase [Thiocapsa imhoffii]